jgi:hypothetical protein
MVDLGIIKRHGELTAEFKQYLEDYLKDQFLTYYSKDQDIKSISELGQSDDSNIDYLNTRKLMILIAIFIGMQHTEIMKVCYSEDRHRQDKAFDLEQMALIVKECLRVKKA